MTITLKFGDKKKITINPDEKTYTNNYYACKIIADFTCKAKEYNTAIEILEQLNYKKLER